MPFILIIYFLLFFFIAWRNLPNAIAILVALLPSYLIRFHFWILPTTLLEGMIIIIVTIWFWQIGFPRTLKRYKKKLPYHKFPFQDQIILIIITATISVFIAPNFYKALGLWRAYFLEPVLFFLIFIQAIHNRKNLEKILYALGISALIISVFAIYQKITGKFMPTPFLYPDAPKRITSFYTSPNAVGLFLAPIIMIYLGWIFEEKIKNIFSTLWKAIVLTLSIIAVIFTISHGTWIGLIIALILFNTLILYKKYKINIVILLGTITFIGVAILFIFNYSFIKKDTEQIIQSPSAQNRIILWQNSWSFLTKNPKNFILGAGIFGFPQIQNSFRDPLKMEPLIYPHNIFLNFWLDIGLLGMLSFIWIIVSFLKQTLFYISSDKRKKNVYLIIGIIGAMSTILVHGLIDVPYFKNDLAILFWIIIGIFIIIKSLDNKYAKKIFL